MCTMIVETAPISGTGKGTQDWIKVDQVNVSFDHPFKAPFDHALNIDFVDSSKGPGARVAVEIDAESAKRLVKSIQAALEQGKEYH